MVNDNVVLEARSKVDKPSRISIYMQTQGLVGVSTWASKFGSREEAVKGLLEAEKV
jgi:hypothetical protein